MVVLATFLLADSVKAEPAKVCATIDGTYAIYANHDLLHVDHSRHFIEVGSDVLDTELQKRGWQDTAAVGLFTLCARRAGSPASWTIRDHVKLVAFRHIRFVVRPGR